MNKQFPLIIDHMEKKNKTWDSVFESLKKQLFLRMLSCIQIANKLYSNHFVRFEMIDEAQFKIKIYLDFDT